MWLAMPLVVMLAIVAWRLPGLLRSTSVLDELPPSSRPGPGPNLIADAPDPVKAPAALATYVSARLDAYWKANFGAMGRVYQPPTLRLFDAGIQIPCFPWMAFEDGPPFYCFLDDTIYLPVPYVSDVATSVGGWGRAAVAYVLAHEYAHHVQHLTGLSRAVEERTVPDGPQLRKITIRYELQADCLAGVWASSVYQPGVLTTLDMGRAIGAAAQIRDPRGTSAQSHGSLLDRQRSFWAGYASGRASTCKSQ